MSIPCKSGALILGLSQDGMIQDLGPFNTGINMETDILPGSAILCRADEEGNPVVDQGRIRIAFEGNLHGATNLNKFAEKVQCAAGRLAQDAPSVAYGTVSPDQIEMLASYDLTRGLIVDILDPDALSKWSGEPVGDVFLPKLPSGTSISAGTGVTDHIDMHLKADPAGVMAWRVSNGQILMRTNPTESFKIYDLEDKRCASVLRELDLADHIHRRLWGEDPPPTLSPDGP